MATSTYMTFLMHKGSGDAWTKLVDINDFPDLGGAPELIEVTNLSQRMQTYIEGIQSADGLEFEMNYDPTDYQKLKALKGKNESYAIWFGGDENDVTGVPTPTGSLGKFEFDGTLSCYVKGGGTNEARKTGITIAPSTVIVEKFD